MQVSTVYNYRGIQNVNQNQPQTKPSQNYLFQTSKNISNSPSFGFSIQDLFRGVVKPLSAIRELQRENQIKKVNLRVRDDIELLSKRLNISKDKAASRYQSNLDIGGIEPAELEKNQVGLNKIVGRSLEKLELIKNVIAPIVKSVKPKYKNIADDSQIPNGIIIHGKEGSGKSHMMDSLKEHLNQKSEKIWGWTLKEGRYEFNRKDIEVVTLNKDWQKGDTDENFYAIVNAFEDAKNNHILPHNRKSHTFIVIDNIENILNNPNAELLKTELEYRTQNCAKDGITWAATTNTIKNLPDWLLKEDRASIVMPLGTIRSDAEKSALLSHFIAHTNRKDVSNHDKVLDYLDENLPRSYPVTIKNIVESIDKELFHKDYTASTLYDRAKVKTQYLFDAIDNYAENYRTTNNIENPFKNFGGKK